MLRQVLDCYNKFLGDLLAHNRSGGLQGRPAEEGTGDDVGCADVHRATHLSADRPEGGAGSGTKCWVRLAIVLPQDMQNLWVCALFLASTPKHFTAE